ncbi:MAG: cytochrome c oxidase subunit 3 family protein [Armatimonadota bacterium]
MAADVHGGHGAHGLVQHQFDDLAQQRESFSLGMWLFLATEVMMFGGLFFAYFLYRWLYPAAFIAGSAHMNIQLGFINTMILLVSSWTVVMAVHAAVERKKKTLVTFLVITWVLGALFLVIKGFEWGHDWDIGLIPGLNWTFYDNPANHHELEALAAAGIGPHHVQMFFTIYFCMTGLHAIHMIIGLILVGTFIVLAARGTYTSGNDQPVEIMGLYWHLIDIIWIFLFPLLYLIGHVTLAQIFGGGGGGH